MKVSVVQSNITWEDATANRAAFAERLEAARGADLVLLPEMFTTGFSMQPEFLAEQPEGETFKWMREQSRRINAAIAGSYIVAHDGTYRNRMLWAEPGGKYAFYDKRHLFRMANEHEHYSPGNQQVIINFRGWNILLLVCYDLRFPVWSRNVSQAYDMVLICANWPASRRHAWFTLLAARAIENQCYVVACNRVGTDGQGRDYSGDSAIFDPKGFAITAAKPDAEQTISAELNLLQLNEFRESFPVHLDADRFALL